MNNDTQSHTTSTLLKVFLIFYILIGNSALQPLLSHQWNKLIEKNRIAQHVVGLTTMIALVALVADHTNIGDIVFYGSSIYLLFVLSTKMDIQTTIIMMIIVLLGYMYEKSLCHEEKQVIDDKVLTENEKELMFNANNNKRMMVFFALLATMITGIIVYSNSKTVQYGGGYSLWNFLLY